MEHIRAAIDKARKEREAAQKPGSDAPVLTEQMPEDADSAALAQTWEALPTFKVALERLKRARILTYQAGHDATDRKSVV